MVSFQMGRPAQWRVPFVGFESCRALGGLGGNSGYTARPAIDRSSGRGEEKRLGRAMESGLERPKIASRKS